MENHDGADDIGIEFVELFSRNPIFLKCSPTDFVRLEQIEILLANPEAKDKSHKVRVRVFRVPIPCDFDGILLGEDGIEDRLPVQPRRKTFATPILESARVPVVPRVGRGQLWHPWSWQFLLQRQPTSLHKQRIGSLIIRSLWQAGVLNCLIEILVEADPPFFSFVPGNLPSFDGKQLIPVFIHTDWNETVTQDIDARNQQSDQVHYVLPFHLSLIADVGLHFFEL